MIAETIKAAWPQMRGVTVDMQTIRVTDPAKRRRYIYFTPRPAQIALIYYDRGIMPEPFEVRLERAGQIISTRRLRHKDAVARRAASVVTKRKNRAVTNEHRDLADVRLQGPDVKERRRQVTRALHKTFDDPAASLGPARAVSYDGSFHGAHSSAMVVGGQPPPLGNMLGGDLPPKEQRKPANMARMRRFGLKQMIE
jgi:hypothetical protein